MDTITVTKSTIPVCDCGDREWICKQRIDRESELLAVDGLSDLRVAKPDELLYRQYLILQCSKCNRQYQPISTYRANVKAWAEKPIDLNPLLDVEAWFDDDDAETHEGADGYGWKEPFESNADAEDDF